MSNEIEKINDVANQHSKRYAVVALLKEEPVGIERLLELSGHTV